MKGRVFGSVGAFLAYWLFNILYSPAATVLSGQAAGRQFENNDVVNVTALYQMHFWSGIGKFATLALVVALAMIWWTPVKRWIATLAVVGMAVVALSPQQAEAYYDKQDWAETYFILPNESAFYIPDIGANKDSQVAFGSEAYLAANKIAAKRFSMPHVKLENSGAWSNYYVNAGRLILVDRTPQSREWVSTSHRGTSKKDESFPCQSKEGLNISVGIALGVSTLEENSPKYLHRFGVKTPAGDRTKPEVVFTSVFYGTSLREATDGVVRNMVQSLVCEEFTKRSFDEGNAQASTIMVAIRKSTETYLKTVGITLDFIGWADTFGFDKSVQDAINRQYVARQEKEIAIALAPHTATLQALANAQATRHFVEKFDGKLPTNVSLWWLPSGFSDFLSGLMGKSPEAPTKK